MYIDVLEGKKQKKENKQKGQVKNKVVRERVLWCRKVHPQSKFTRLLSGCFKSSNVCWQ